MSPSPEDQAMQQLHSQQSRLLDKIDELRAVGVGGLVELPQLIVCGNKSSGKSSVLEAISRVRFPAKSSCCTRFATEVILRRSTQPKFKVSIEPGASRTNEAERQKLRNFATQGFSSYRDLPRIIEQATECMGISDEDTANSGFSDDVLKVAISGPDQPELTLVDLPGLYTSTSHAQGAKGIEIVRGLTEKYMKSTRTIILAVISAKTDYHLQGVLNMAERFDSKRQRTIGIITQPDILEAGSEEESNYLQFMRNEKINLRLGWHALRNRSFETREMSDDSRDEMERTFFEQGRWASLSRDCVGVDSLRRRLSSVLLQHIRRNLPGLITEIQDKIADHQQRLARLGPARSTLQQQRGFLLAISSGFERITRQALSGMYADEFFTELGDDTQDSQDFRRLRAVIRELNECFAHAMNIRGSRRILVDMLKQNYDLQLEKDKMYMEDWSPEYVTREALEEEIGGQARKNRGMELPGSANQLLVGSLFRDQSKPWEGIARVHLLHTWESVKYFVLLLLRHLADEPTYTRLVETVFAPQLERLKDTLLNKLEELTAYMKRGQPFPIGDSFLSKIRVARTTRHLAALRKALGLPRSIFVRNGDPESFNAHDVALAASKLQSSSDEFAVAEIIDQMEAYYDTTIVTFVDNIAILGIENCLLWPLEQIFTSQTVNSMEDQQIRELAEEPPHIQHDRQRLSQELNRLQAGLNTFNIFHAGSSSLRPPSIFVKPAVAQPALFQSPDTIALREKCKPNSKTPSAPTKRSPSPPVVADNNRNRNTTACSTRNQGSLFGTPSVSTENTASPPVVSDNSSSKNTTASSTRNAFPLFAPPPGPTFTGNSGTGNDSNSTNAKMKKSAFGPPVVLGCDSARTSGPWFGSSFTKADAAKPSAGTGPGFFGRPSSSQPTGSFSFGASSDTPTKNDTRKAPATEGPRR
ncbi:P-loop containing nucleoside triphosphate hydrolase protein [Aspergillus pseudonomiae]|uniref:P-loop containing nucleoside triphosphate hydrolase protein n=1 Tax=Aspergillus pseudonomiae TaxID=1506151 RepID=A0A5N7CVH5_9EURO|nr:P-loop containing nucleoside triphosphate hydrolase protein [Aspergillus pseudonomiae]KAE8397593.1 P-loop containing nucleoside triphosphate hydrolase protein [Aspergillus pseudonomiae]